MNLLRVGNTVLNIDRINGILDHQVATDPAAPAGRTVLRIMFDNAQIDLTDKEAQTFRRWFRHAARDLTPHRDEEGEELISPEEQVRGAMEALTGLVDRIRPRDSALRHATHRLAGIVDHFLTGELQPSRASDFARSFPVEHVES